MAEDTKPHTPAEKAATIIWDHNFGAWCGLNAGQMTPIIQTAIDAETKPLVEALRIALGYWRPRWNDMVEEPEEAADGPTYNKCIAALAPFKEGGAK